MVRRVILSSVFALFFLPLFAQPSGKNGLTLTQFEEKLRNTSEPQILDVRSPQEFDENHLKGAINFFVPDDEQLATASAGLNKNKPVFVYSINNGRSTTVSAKLVAAGFKEVYALPGGLAHWIGAGNPIETSAGTGTGLTKAEFDKLIPVEEVVLVDVGSKHCGGCKKLAPVVEEISHEQGVKVIKIELYDNRQLAKELGIESVPTLILYKGKTPIWRKSGAMTKNEIVDALDNSL
ncbi:MAG TPA: thioredoxin domain-containing protein [Chryseolinea sp.]|nr:thioredoxin domain-containing protein [Chryseolinea sp.]